MKKFFSSALMSLTILMSTSTASYADDGNTLRYFFQQPGQVSSSTPYGNNTKAGKYALSDDAKIYYETYDIHELPPLHAEEQAEADKHA